MRQTDKSVYLSGGVSSDFSEGVPLTDEVFCSLGEVGSVLLTNRSSVAFSGFRLMDATTVNNDSRSFFMSGTD